LPRKERERLVNTMSLKRMTANTITNPQTLMAELQQIARQGYALDNEEFMDGMVATAVPVRDPNGRFVAALAFHGPVQRISIDHAIARAEDVRAAAERLGEVLFS
jgi:DNA-binding IclR family transcriptional regulator